MGGCLVFILGIGFGILAGVLTDSIIVGIVVSLIACGSLAITWNEAGATINMATQDQRDREIISELKKMNEDK